MKYFIAISLYFVALAHKGLAEDFNSDDMMNLAVTYLKPLSQVIKGAVLFWTGYIRPLGCLFYLLVYSYAGFWSAPFRVACFALMIVNLALLWRLFLRLSESREFAALALLVVCFHASMSDLYLSTGTIFDILCQLFFLLALTSRRLAVIALCTVAAVDSKEVGVAIPAVLLVYELTFHRRSIRWPAVAVSAAVSMIFMWSRFMQPNELTNHEAYQVTLTAHQYLLTNANYINQLLFHARLNESAALAVLLLPLAAAAMLRSKLVLFGWLYYVLTLAPMSFSLPRYGYALYIPYTGVAIMLSAMFLEISHTKARQIAMAAFAAVVVIVQLRQSATAMNGSPWGKVPMHAVVSAVHSKYPSLPKGSRLLLVNDPFQKEMYLPRFVLTLLYRDPTLTADKATWNTSRDPFEPPPEKYDHIFLFDGDSAVELKPGSDDGRPLAFVHMSSHEASRSIVQGVGGIGAGEQMRWVNQDPIFAFRVPRQPARFQMNFEVPDVVLHETGPLDVECWIAERQAPGMIVSKAGAARYETALPTGLRTGEVISVRLHTKNPFIAKNDGARLSFLLQSAGFVPE